MSLFADLLEGREGLTHAAGKRFAGGVPTVVASSGRLCHDARQSLVSSPTGSDRICRAAKAARPSRNTSGIDVLKLCGAIKALEAQGHSADSASAPRWARKRGGGASPSRRERPPASIP